jgi:hypothetical protein
LQEALTLSDMIIGGLSTTTTDGKILESAGMFKCHLLALLHGQNAGNGLFAFWSKKKVIILL